MFQRHGKQADCRGGGGAKLSQKTVVTVYGFPVDKKSNEKEGRHFAVLLTHCTFLLCVIVCSFFPKSLFNFSLSVFIFISDMYLCLNNVHEDAAIDLQAEGNAF